MRPWASWTAKMAMLAAGFAAAGGGLSGVALAGTGGSSTSGNASVLSGNQLITPVSLPLDVCGSAAAVLGAARPLAGLGPLSGLAPLSAATGISRPATVGLPALAPGSGATFDNTLSAGPGAGDTNVPAASQMAGLGAPPGLADLPSLAGLANTAP
jgi:hypothetical protein